MEHSRIREYLRRYAVLQKDIGSIAAARFGMVKFLHLQALASDVVTVKSDRLEFPVRLRVGTSDRSVFHQVCSDEQYGPLRTVRDVRVIVDCGANIGITTAYLLTMFREARAIAIEPDAANAAMCRLNLAPYGTRATVIEAGIWSQSTHLDQTRKARGHEWGVRVYANPEGAIPAIDIPSLGLASIDILKVDIEGSEQELFSPSAAFWLGTVRNIAIELHDPACAAAFQARLEDYNYESSRSGELTICRNLSHRCGAADGHS